MAVIFSIAGSIGGGMGGLVDVDVDVALGRAGILVAAVDLVLANDEGGLAAVGAVAVVFADVDGGVAAHTGTTAAAVGEGHLASEEVDGGVACDIAGEGVVAVVAHGVEGFGSRSLPRAFAAAVYGRADIAAVDVDFGVAEHLAVLAAAVGGVLEVAAVEVNLTVVAGGEGGVVGSVGTRDTTAAAAKISAKGIVGVSAAANGVAIQG